MMKIFTALLVSILFLAASSVWAKADESLDLRYCLALQSNYEIAKCAGEISPGRKGKPYSKEKVDEILSGAQASASISVNDLSGTSATDNDLLPEDNEGSSD